MISSQYNKVFSHTDPENPNLITVYEIGGFSGSSKTGTYS
jgi:uncharacterized protein YkwD